MKYKIEITFDSSNELSDKELAGLEDSLVLQILEPIDSEGNDCDWDAQNIRMDIEKVVD